MKMKEHFDAANTCLACRCGSVKFHVRADNALECAKCGIPDDYMLRVIKKTLKSIAEECMEIAHHG